MTTPHIHFTGAKDREAGSDWNANDILGVAQICISLR